MLKERPAVRLDDCGMLPDHVGDRVGGGVLSRSRHEVRCLRSVVSHGSLAGMLSAVLVAVCCDLESHPIRA